jgi:hypothetical protein
MSLFYTSFTVEYNKMILKGKRVSKGGTGFFKCNIQVSDDGINESHKPTESASNQIALK